MKLVYFSSKPSQMVSFLAKILNNCLSIKTFSDWQPYFKVEMIVGFLKCVSRSLP